MARHKESRPATEQLRYPDRDCVVGVMRVPDSCISDIQLHPDVATIVPDAQFQDMMTKDYIRTHAKLTVPLSHAKNTAIMPFYSGRVMPVWEDQDNPLTYAGFLSHHITQKGGGFSGALAFDATIVNTLLQDGYTPGLATVWDDDGDSDVTTALLARGARTTFRYGRIILDSKATQATLLDAYKDDPAYTLFIEAIWQRVEENGDDLCIPFRIGDTLTRLSHVHHLYKKWDLQWNTKQAEIFNSFRLFRQEMERGIGIGPLLGAVVPEHVQDIYELFGRLSPTHPLSREEEAFVQLPLVLTAAQTITAVESLYRDPNSPVLVGHDSTIFSAKDIGPGLCATDMDIAWKSAKTSRKAVQKTIDTITHNYDNTIWYMLLFLTERFPDRGDLSHAITHYKDLLATLQ